MRRTLSTLATGALLAAATVFTYLGPLDGARSPSEALGDATRPYVISTPIFTPKSATSFTALMTSRADTSMSCLLRRYDAVGTLLTSQAITIGAHGSLQASPSAHSGAPLHVEIWCPKPYMQLLVTYTDSSDITRRIEPGDMAEPHEIMTGAFVPLAPARLCDTRAGTGTGCSGNALTAGETMTVTAGGLAGIPATASAIMFSAQAKAPTAAGYFTFFPNGAARPQVSQVTFAAAETVTTTVTVKLGSAAAFRVFNAAGTVNLIVDVAGYFT